MKIPSISYYNICLWQNYPKQFHKIWKDSSHLLSGELPYELKSWLIVHIMALILLKNPTKPLKKSSYCFIHNIQGTGNCNCFVFFIQYDYRYTHCHFSQLKLINSTWHLCSWLSTKVEQIGLDKWVAAWGCKGKCEFGEINANY